MILFTFLLSHRIFLHLSLTGDFILFLGTKPNGNGVKNDYGRDPTGIPNNFRSEIRNKALPNDAHNNAIPIIATINGPTAGGSMAGISVASSVIPHNGTSHAGIVGSSWKSPVIGAVATPGTPSAISGAVGVNKTPRGNIVVALYTYQGSEFGDMSFKKGDQMEILDKS